VRGPVRNGVRGRPFNTIVRHHLNVWSRATVLIATSVPLYGCFGPAGLSYTGDGSLKDHGVLSYARRYEIDLGAIDATVPGVHTYRLSGMPHATFTVNVEVVDSEPNRLGPPRATYAGRIAVEMKNSAGELIIAEREPIDKWVRTYGLGLRNSSFYRRGESVDIPLPGGGARPKHVGVKASGGWGTYFDSEMGENYILRVEVLEPLRPELPARISVIGWDRS